MKKWLIVVFLMISTIFAQDDDGSGVSVYVGLQSMNASGDYCVDCSGSMGFSAGISKPISDKLTIGGGISQRGFKDKSYWTAIDANVDEEWTITAFEIWCTYVLFDTGNVTVWAGPSFAVLNNIEAEFKDDFGNKVEVDEDIDDNDISIMFGISLPVGDSGNSLHAGYQRSIVDVDDEFIFTQLFVSFSMTF